MPLEPAKKERSLIRHALAVGQARIVLLLPTHLLKTFHLLYIPKEKRQVQDSR